MKENSNGGNRKAGSKRKNSNVTYLKEVKDDPKRIASMRRRKNSKKKNILVTKIFAAFVFLMFIVYIFGYFIVMFNREYTKTVTIMKGNGEEPIKARGVIIRDETVFTTEKSGQLKFLKNDQDKIRAGDLVAIVENSESVTKLSKEMENIEKKILELQNFRADFSVAQNDARRINSQIKNVVDNTILDFSINNLSEVYKLKDNIEKKMELRNKILIDDSNNTTSTLVGDMHLTLEELYKNEYEIKANTPGIVSYYVDNFEEEFNITKLYEIQKSKIPKSDPEINLATKRNISEGEKVFKLIKSNTWYIASYVESKLIDGWEEGDKRFIFLESDKGFVKLESLVDKLETTKNDSYVVLKLTRNLLDFVDKRFVSFKITDKDVTGYKIPVSSIIEKSAIVVPKKFVNSETEDTFYVNRQGEDGSIEKVSITPWISAGENDYYLKYQDASLRPKDILVYEKVLDANEINQSDNVSTTEKYEITEIENVFGVYVSNSGISKFTKIVLEDNLKNIGEFSLLDPEKNLSIKVNDIIILDANSVEENEKIYKKPDS